MKMEGSIKMNNRVRKMVMAALLTAIAIIIPIQFGFLRIVLGPFTATLGAHIPMMIAMLVSPMVALVVGVGSAVGFMITTGAPVVALRALMHAPVGFIGAKIVAKDKSYIKALIITAPIHGILEAIAVMFFGFDISYILVTVAVGTIIHHGVDSLISYALSTAMAKAKRKDLYSAFN